MKAFSMQIFEGNGNGNDVYTMLCSFNILSSLFAINHRSLQVTLPVEILAAASEF
jgi:hypothetical protein